MKTKIQLALILLVTGICGFAVNAESASSNDFVIKNGVLIKYKGKSADVVIPNSVKKIDSYAFSGNKSLKSVVIPNSVTSIESDPNSMEGGAFASCINLVSVTVSGSVTKIGDSAFVDCSKLSKLTLSEGLVTISKGAFNGCKSLIDVKIPNSVKSIGSYAFCNSGIREIIIPANVKNIEFAAFGLCDELSEINVVSGNKTYNSLDGVLFSKDMTKIISYPTAKIDAEYFIPSSVSRIGNYAFYGNIFLEKVEITGNLKSINPYAFDSCKNLKSIIIPNTVTEIAYRAFQDCYKLEKITIPNSVVKWGLIEFDMGAGKTDIQEGPVFDGCDDLIIYCKSGSGAHLHAQKYNVKFKLI